MAILKRHAASVLAVAALCAACGGASEELLVLHTANTYGYFDTCGCRSDSTGGLAKRAWVIDSLRHESDDPILLVDAGDFTGGENAYGAALGRVLIDAMELMGYDAYTLGEWDLNQGPGYVRSVVEENPIAWVHTNYDVAGLEDRGHKTLVVEKGGRRIGLLGLLNPTIQISPAVRDSVTIEEDIVASARRGVEELRAQHVDGIVVLSHLSYKADRALAERVEGIDLIVSGHGGKSLLDAENVMPNTWVVASGDLGRFLGRVVMRFGGRSGSTSAVRDVEGDLIVMTPDLPNDPRLDPLFARYEEERQALMRRELGARRAPQYFRAPPPAPEETTIPLEAPGS